MTTLLRRLTPRQMLLLSINGMVGSAWLFAPLYAARLAGGNALISWLLGGFATLLIAMTFAELSAALPVTGGTTQFAQLSSGKTTGFVISWISWLSCVTMPPIEVQAFLQYLATFFPSLMEVHQGVPELSHVGLFWASLTMLGLVGLNIASFKGFVRSNVLIFTFKIAVIVFTISALIHARFELNNFTQLKGEHSGWHGILAAVSTAGIAFAFTGFKHGVELAGETTHSHRTIPLGILGSIATCLVLYLGLQIAFIGALDPTHIHDAHAALNLTHATGPFVGLAQSLGLTLLLGVLLIDAAVSPLGAGLVYVTSTARMVYAMSESRYLPSSFLKLNRQHLPIAAILFNFFVGLLLFLPLPGWQNMVEFLVSAVVISYALGPLTLLSLRQRLPNVVRPFRLPFAPILGRLAFYCCNLMSFWTGWDTLKKLDVAVLLGLSYFLLTHRHHRNHWELGSFYWFVAYLAGLSVLSYCGTFGGKGWLPFGWDFVAIAVLTEVIARWHRQTQRTAEHIASEWAAVSASPVAPVAS